MWSRFCHGFLAKGPHGAIALCSVPLSAQLLNTNEMGRPSQFPLGENYSKNGTEKRTLQISWNYENYIDAKLHLN